MSKYRPNEGDHGGSPTIRMASPGPETNAPIGPWPTTLMDATLAEDPPGQTWSTKQRHATAPGPRGPAGSPAWDCSCASCVLTGDRKRSVHRCMGTSSGGLRVVPRWWPNGRVHGRPRDFADDRAKFWLAQMDDVGPPRTPLSRPGSVRLRSSSSLSSTPLIRPSSPRESGLSRLWRHRGGHRRRSGATSVPQRSSHPVRRIPA